MHQLQRSSRKDNTGTIAPKLYSNCAPAFLVALALRRQASIKRSWLACSPLRFRLAGHWNLLVCDRSTLLSALQHALPPRPSQWNCHPLRLRAVLQHLHPFLELRGASSALVPRMCRSAYDANGLVGVELKSHQTQDLCPPRRCHRGVARCRLHVADSLLRARPSRCAPARWWHLLFSCEGDGLPHDHRPCRRGHPKRVAEGGCFPVVGKTSSGQGWAHGGVNSGGDCCQLACRGQAAGSGRLAVASQIPCLLYQPKAGSSAPADPEPILLRRVSRWAVRHQALARHLTAAAHTRLLASPCSCSGRSTQISTNALSTAQCTPAASGPHSSTDPGILAARLRDWRWRSCVCDGHSSLVSRPPCLLPVVFFPRALPGNDIFGAWGALPV